MTDGGRLSLPPSFVLEKHEAAKPRERKESIPCDETANSLSPLARTGETEQWRVGACLSILID